MKSDTTQAPPAVGGTVTIKPEVVFSLALEATLSTYGVVGIASRYTGAEMTRREPRRGLDVKISDAPDGTIHVRIDAHVIVEYGVRIDAVINSLQHQISYTIQHSTGYIVDAVNVHVASLRITHAD